MPRWSKEDAFDGAVNAASSSYNVPVALIKAIIGAESAFVPSAYRAEVKINDGSAGLMQILYATARGEGYTGSLGDRNSLTGLFDPATNIRYGTSYLSSQLERANGFIPGAISAYNGGWRPDIGFGAVATRPVTICLARDSAGKCIQSRNVPVGEFGNQAYVNTVLSNYNYFLGKTPLPTGGTAATPPASTPSIGGLAITPKLLGVLVGLLIGLISLQHSRK